MTKHPFFLSALCYSIALIALAFFASTSKAETMDKTDETIENSNVAIFAGGCFWCMESVFDYADGVSETVSGYIGGSADTAHYKAVGTGKTDHTEALRVTYDPSAVSYEQLLTLFWENIDPLDAGGQFADRGSQYRTAIFVINDEQKAAAEKSKAEVEKRLSQKVATTIEQADTFYAAEDYHQNYHKDNAIRYKMYYYGSGRPDRLKEVWGDK